jgi:hypothetical protein
VPLGVEGAASAHGAVTGAAIGSGSPRPSFSSSLPLSHRDRAHRHGERARAVNRRRRAWRPRRPRLTDARLRRCGNACDKRESSRTVSSVHKDTVALSGDSGAEWRQWR